MGAYVFPSQPLYDPNTPEQDGAPYVRVAKDSVILDFGGEKFVMIPFRAIRKGSIVIHPGGPLDVNGFTLQLICSGISVDDDGPALDEVLVQTTERLVDRADI